MSNNKKHKRFEVESETDPGLETQLDDGPTVLDVVDDGVVVTTTGFLPIASSEVPDEDYDEDGEDEEDDEDEEDKADPVVELRRQVDEAKAAPKPPVSRGVDPTKRIRSGSKPRPTTTYVLLSRPPKWSGPPQVASLQKILFENNLGPGGTVKTELSEPELFALVEQGARDGILKTAQSPVRIFQYYRSALRKVDAIEWK